MIAVFAINEKQMNPNMRHRLKRLLFKMLDWI